MRHMDVLVYGDINIDLVVPGVSVLPAPGREEFVPRMETYVGGGAALFALGLGKLSVDVAFKGTVGDDLYGDFIHSYLKRNGVDTSLLCTDTTYGTGISISFTNEKDRCFLSSYGTNILVDLDQMTEEEIACAGHLHLTGYQGSLNHAKYERILNRLEGTKTTVSMDVGWDSSEEWSEEIIKLLPKLDVFFMNEEEVIHYTRCSDPIKGIRRFGEYGNIVVGKLGSKGSVVYQKGELISLEPYQVEAVDTTGAGDSFNAGFIYGFLKKEPLLSCLCYGNACGAMSVTAFGGNTAFPNEVTLKAFLASR